jgi:tRNA 5-methylaminomethyl-2-thiouridine biosynthesis bifunctional protein
MAVVEDSVESRGKASHSKTRRLSEDKIWLDYKNAGVVLPEVLCRVLKQRCGDALSIVHENIDELKSKGNRCFCFSNSQLINEADCLVIANGVSVNELGISPELPIESIRGQALVLQTKSDSKTIGKGTNKVINAGVYFTPALVGKHYLGASYSPQNQSTVVDAEENISLLQSLDKIYPDSFTSDDVTESWVGFRCMAKDRVPVVGALPDVAFFSKNYADINHGKRNKLYPAAQYQPGLYITAAHGSRGFTSSFLSAEIIAAQICGEPSPVNKDTLDYLNPSRFIVNKLKRR